MLLTYPAFGHLRLVTHRCADRHPGGDTMFVVEWYLEPTAATVPALRREIRGYLGRHADGEDGLDDAELIASELLSNGAQHSDGPLWVTLRWRDERPVLSVADLGPGFELDPGLPDDPRTTGGRGLFIVDQLAESLHVTARRGQGTVVTATLPVRRRPSDHVERSGD